MAETKDSTQFRKEKLRNFVDEDAQDADGGRADGQTPQEGQFARISATETSLTLVPVGPVRIRPPHFWRAW